MRLFITFVLILTLSGCVNFASVQGGSSVTTGGVTYSSKGSSPQEVAFEMGMQLASQKGFNFCETEDYSDFAKIDGEPCFQMVIAIFGQKELEPFEANIAKTFLKYFAN